MLNSAATVKLGKSYRNFAEALKKAMADAIDTKLAEYKVSLIVGSIGIRNFFMSAVSIISRRQWLGSGLATCGYLAAASVTDGQPTVPKGYTRPAPDKERGLAPMAQVRLISEQSNGEKNYAVVFGKDDEILSGLTEFAEREKITAGQFTAIGALRSVKFGWFDRTKKAYHDILVNQQVEMVSLIGNVALVNGAPQIHAHGAVGFPDGQLRGGHLLRAIAWPTLEVFFTTFPATLIKKHDEETDLSLYDLKA
jgi:predicted DNA-binding protein with PD1-like motif